MPEPKPQTLDLKAFKMAHRPRGAFDKLHKLVQLLRHYDKVQIARRGINLLRKKLQPGRRVGECEFVQAALNDRPIVKQLANRIISGQRDHPSHSHCDPVGGRFVLLNKAVDFTSDPFDRQTLSAQTHLWRFQYHYHEHLMAQAAAGNWAAVVAFLEGWLIAFDPTQTLRRDDSWHPYCISRRLPVWVWLLHESRQKKVDWFTESLSNRLLQSAVHQANYLADNLEYDLGGNHLLENATALAIVGGAVECKHSLRWRKLAASVLQNELPKQVLPYGEHFELSPMYHCQILSNLLRIAICCADDSQLASAVDSRIDPMLQFLSRLVHPDGEIPLFADSVFQEAPSVKEICDLADIAECSGALSPLEEQQSDCCSIGGYRIFRSASLFAICDFGPVAAPKLPAHGHCDATTLEVSVEGHRWIVDSGNFNYGDDSMRHYCRSSLAHNVVTIDDENQASIWSKFRMGHRPQVQPLPQCDIAGWTWAGTYHDGYRTFGTAKMTRVVGMCDQTLACVDVGTSRAGDSRRMVGYLHLHPDVEVSACGIVLLDGVARHYRIGLQRNGVQRDLTMLADEVTIEQGWYCPAFGQRRLVPVLRYVTEAGEDVTGWMLHELGVDAVIRCSNESVLIKMGNQEVSLDEYELLNED